MAKFDNCVDTSLNPLPAAIFLPVVVAVDASLKHDSTAVVVVTVDDKGQVRLVFDRVFQPTPEQPLDFEQTIEATLLELSRKYLVKKILFDPWQMQSVAQRLIKQGLPIEEFAQSTPNLTAASQCLFDLIESHHLVSQRCNAIGSVRVCCQRESTRLENYKRKEFAQDRRDRCAGNGLPRRSAVAERTLL
ncbi:MAG: hypothetical protein WAV38_07605 [Xanthobacteraceae bacterium]